MADIRAAMDALWRKLGVDITDPNLTHIDPNAISVSRKKLDAVMEELNAEFPDLMEHKFEWSMAYLQYGPLTKKDQEEDIIIPEGAIRYGKQSAE